MCSYKMDPIITPLVLCLVKWYMQNTRDSNWFSLILVQNKVQQLPVQQGIKKGLFLSLFQKKTLDNNYIVDIAYSKVKCSFTVLNFQTTLVSMSWVHTLSLYKVLVWPKKKKNVGDQREDFVRKSYKGTLNTLQLVCKEWSGCFPFISKLLRDALKNL